MIVKDILDYLDREQINYSFYGEEAHEIFSYCPLKELQSNSITWARFLDIDTVNRISETEVLLVVEDNKFIDKLNCDMVVTDNPHRVFFKLIKHFFYSKPEAHVPKMSIIESNNVGEGASIGEFCFIGADVIIGKNCTIGNNVTIEGKVLIGDNAIIDSGVRIGTKGFGHSLNDDGTNEIIPHLGGVTIGNNVFVGANTIIARGTLSDTIVGDDVMIDALCGICHNSIIEERVMVAGGAGVAGSAVVKHDSWLAPGCIVNAGVVVGEFSMIGINSVVSHDIPPKKYAFGIPAKVLGDNKDSKYKI